MMKKIVRIKVIRRRIIIIIQIRIQDPPIFLLDPDPDLKHYRVTEKKTEILELIYASSTAVLFHMGMLEPQSLRKSYVAFLDQVTGKKLVS